MSTATIDQPKSAQETAALGPGLMTINQASRFLAVGKSTIYDLIKSGRLPAYPIGPSGGAMRVCGSDLTAYLESVRTGQAVAPVPVPVKRRKLERLTPKHAGGRKRAAG